MKHTLHPTQMQAISDSGAFTKMTTDIENIQSIKVA